MPARPSLPALASFAAAPAAAQRWSGGEDVYLGMSDGIACFDDSSG